MGDPYDGYYDDYSGKDNPPDYVREQWDRERDYAQQREEDYWNRQRENDYYNYYSKNNYGNYGRNEQSGFGRLISRWRKK